MKYDKVIVCVHNNDELGKLVGYAKYMHKGDVVVRMRAKREESLKKEPVEMDESVYILFTSDGYAEDTSTFHIFKDEYPLIPIEPDMFKKDHSVSERSKVCKKNIWRHYGNDKHYRVIDYCKIQINDQWVEGVIYCTTDHDSKYVRPIDEFIEKFEHAIPDEDDKDYTIINDLLIAKAFENDGNEPFLSVDDILLIKASVPEEEDRGIIDIHKWLKDMNYDVILYRDLDAFLKKEYELLREPNLGDMTPICQNVMNRLGTQEQVIVGTMCYKDLSNTKDIAHEIRKDVNNTAAVISNLVKKGVLYREDGVLMVSSILKDWFKLNSNRRKTDV